MFITSTEAHSDWAWAQQLSQPRGQDTGHTHCICYPKCFTSHLSQQDRLKDAKGERSSSGELVAATGATHLSHSLGSPWEEGWLVSLSPCAGGSSSFPAALQVGIALVWWAASGNVGVTGQGLWIKACVPEQNTADAERDWILCAAGKQLNCTILANDGFLLKNICG